MTDETKAKEAKATDSPIKRWTLERDGDRPLRFRGEKIGEGESGSGGTSGYKCDWTRGVRVSIYRTTGGNYVVRRNYWSCWQGEGARLSAALCRSPVEVLEALRDDDGAIRTAEAEALDEASDDPGIATVAVEQVD